MAVAWCITGYDDADAAPGYSLAFKCCVPEEIEPSRLVAAVGLLEGSPLDEGYYPLTPRDAVALLSDLGVEALPAGFRYALEEDWS